MSIKDDLKLIDQLPRDFDTEARPKKVSPFSYAVKAILFLNALGILIAVLTRGYWNN